MLKSLKSFAFAAFAVAISASLTPAAAGKYGLGRDALAEEVAAWNIDVRPDGQGLPDGSGDVAQGEEIFNERCASCHGDFGEGKGRWPVLAGGFDTLDSEDPVKTVGSYWPYLSTVFDYVNRAMPFGDAQSLTPSETYAIVAYILYLNDLVDDDATLSKTNFTQVKMPNASGFIDDARPDTKPDVTSADICMKNCKTEVKILKRARILDVTPDDTTDDEPKAAQPDSKAAAPAAPAVKVAATTPSTPAAAPAVAAPAGPDPALVKKGAKVFKKCKACHKMVAGKHGIGPSLHGIFGQPAAQVAGFTKSSKAMKKSDLTWDQTTLEQFLAKPRKMVKGTKMSFSGLKKEKDRKAVIAYIRANSAK